ncbi:MAG: IS200/IS605 family accessory protein TnpB-related protein [Methanothrix sp.]|jgi:IS605 OrfB family transposase|nr:transposase [Methanothrix sp.]MCK9407240.1 IS200/IS605 family accessory protein TnpB-related protein [Methanothrix sp.]
MPKVLYACGTDSAKRHLKKLSGKEARFHRDVNHCISKKLVAKAIDTSSAIVLEDLSGIRERITVPKAQRRKQHNWSFYQLRQYIDYKAAIAGVPLICIDPAYTSQECPICHLISAAASLVRLTQSQRGILRQGYQSICPSWPDFLRSYKPIPSGRGS